MATEESAREILINMINKSRNGEPFFNRKIVFPENDDEEMSSKESLNRKSEKYDEKCDDKDPFGKLQKYLRSKNLKLCDCMKLDQFENR